MFNFCIMSGLIGWCSGGSIFGAISTTPLMLPPMGFTTNLWPAWVIVPVKCHQATTAGCAQRLRKAPVRGFELSGMEFHEVAHVRLRSAYARHLGSKRGRMSLSQSHDQLACLATVLLVWAVVLQAKACQADERVCLDEAGMAYQSCEPWDCSPLPRERAMFSVFQRAAAGSLER